MFTKKAFIFLMVVVFFAAESVTQAVDVEVPLIADTMLAGHTAEKEMNCGGRAALRVKGYQGIVVYRFDMSALQGKKVLGGTLTVYCIGMNDAGAPLAKSNSDKISSIAHDWIEGMGDYVVSEDSATFLWPGEEIEETWGEDDTDGEARYGPVDVLDVINGNGDSILNAEGLWEFEIGEWTDIELDEELVQGLVDGEQYGIVIWRDAINVNLDLASREHLAGDFAATFVVHSSGVAVNARGKLAATWGILKSI